MRDWFLKEYLSSVKQARDDPPHIHHSNFDDVKHTQDTIVDKFTVDKKEKMEQGLQAT